MECVYKSTFGLSLVGRSVLFWTECLYQRFHCIDNLVPISEKAEV